jgi:hypothetical protein
MDKWELHELKGGYSDQARNAKCECGATRQNHWVTPAKELACPGRTGQRFHQKNEGEMAASQRPPTKNESPSQLRSVELRRLVNELRQRAQAVGPLHAYWDIIFDIEAFLDGRPTIISKSAEEWVEYVKQMLI